MINYACRYFKGSKPCVFNKSDGSECPACGHASTFTTRILVIKLDALGDVLRTGSLLPAIAARHEAPFIAWLTRPEAVELVRMIRGIDEVIPLGVDGMARVGAGAWDYVYSLSNDLTSASLATLAGSAHPPIGFSMQRGELRPSNQAAARWLDMASFDRLKRENTESYQKIMLDIIGHAGSLDPPALDVDPGLLAQAAARVSALFPGSARRRVAVNIGSGGRWPKKMLDDDQIGRYIRALRSQLDVDVVLVGGRDEVSKAETILAQLGPDTPVRAALTLHSIPEFVAILGQVDALLCGDTLALHVASALGLPAVCVFGPTSAAEIPDFDGLIAKTWVRQLDCLGCYGDCAKARNCMSLFDADDLVDLTRHQLMRGRPVRGARAAT